MHFHPRPVVLTLLSLSLITILVIVKVISAREQITAVSDFAAHYPVKKAFPFKSVRSMSERFPLKAESLISQLGKPDAQTTDIRHWRGSVLESIGHLYSPPVWQWWGYKAFEEHRFKTLNSAVLALFDPPVEQWWYLDQFEKDTYSPYWVLVSANGNIIDCNQELIIKKDFPKLKDFL